MTKSISKRTFIRALGLTTVVFFLLANTNTGGDSSEIELRQANRISESAFNGKANSKATRNVIDLKFNYGKRKSFREAAPDLTVVVSQEALYRIGEELKKQIAFPFDIKVVFEECGGPDSFYDEDTQKITICHELIYAYHDLFSKTLTETAARDEAAKGAIVSMFLHEVAHALILGWDLPITGREEDAADQLSTLFLINGIPDGVQLALDGARSFKLLADLERGDEKDYSDPHSLDEQRFYNTVCLVYGSRPERFEYLIRNGTIPVQRAYECEQIYARANKSWHALLAPHLARK